MSKLIEKYANLLVNYCLAVKKGDQVYINGSYLAEPLLLEVAKATYIAGGLPHFNIELDGFSDLLLEYGEEYQLTAINPVKKYIFENFDCYLNIRAPFTKGDGEKEPLNEEKYKLHLQSQAVLNKIYFDRLGSGAMRRGLCQYPTQAGADDARMTLPEYEQFVFQSCYLYDEDPVAKWLEVRAKQQVYVDRLDKADKVQYKGPNIDIFFSVKGRKWINSDGRIAEVCPAIDTILYRCAKYFTAGHIGATIGVDPLTAFDREGYVDIRPLVLDFVSLVKTVYVCLLLSANFEPLSYRILVIEIA